MTSHQVWVFYQARTFLVLPVCVVEREERQTDGVTGRAREREREEKDRGSERREGEEGRKEREKLRDREREKRSEGS